MTGGVGDKRRSVPVVAFLSLHHLGDRILGVRPAFPGTLVPQLGTVLLLVVYDEEPQPSVLRVPPSITECTGVTHSL